MNDSAPPAVDMSPMRMRGSASRSAARTDSSIVSSRWRATWRGSASSMMWLPPARSRPRLTIGLGSARAGGRRRATSSEGTAASAKNSVTPTARALPEGKSSIGSVRARQSLAGVPPGGTMSPMVDLTALTRTPWAISISAYWSSTLIDLAEQPAGGDDLVALLDRGDLLAWPSAGASAGG
jgi:hypothetical protein